MATRSIRSLSTRRCPECGSDNLVEDYDMGEIICGRCGLVIRDNVMDEGPEWRAFTREEKQKRSRVGTPVSLSVHDKGLSTMIDWHNRDNYGKVLSPVQMNQVFMLRKWQRRIRVADASERNLAFALSEMSKISSSLNLPLFFS